MKIIEALKQIKDLTRKAKDIADKIKLHSADLDYETPSYPDQKGQIANWMQSYRDVCREIGRLKFCLAKTNVNVKVTVHLFGHDITRTIQEWIERRRTLCQMERLSYEALTNKGLRDARIQNSTGAISEHKVRLYFDPVNRDKELDILKSEPLLIDSKLEIVNATTDLME